MGNLNALTDSTANKLRALLGETDGATGAPSRRSIGRSATLVKCTSATAVGGGEDGEGDMCYPAVIVNDHAYSTEPNELSPCWLTVWDVDGEPAVPVEGQLYLTVLSGLLTLNYDDTRQRAFCAAGGGGGLSYTDKFINVPSFVWTPGSSSWSATGFKLKLPVKGTYLISQNVNAAPGSYSGDFSNDTRALYIYSRIRDITNSEDIEISFGYVYGYAVSSVYSVAGTGTPPSTVVIPRENFMESGIFTNVFVYQNTTGVVELELYVFANGPNCDKFHPNVYNCTLEYVKLCCDAIAPPPPSPPSP